MLFCLFSSLLLYTHYYGIFFLAILALLEVLESGLRRSLFNYIIPLILFLPWGMMIVSQLGFHTVHWTDGASSFVKSFTGFFSNTTNLMMSPLDGLKIHELVIVACLFLLVFGVLLLRKRSEFVNLSIVALFYFAQIYLFDQMNDRHTILIPRYHIFFLVFLFWYAMRALEVLNWPATISVACVYSVIAIGVIGQIYSLDRAPKQMFREVASYIDSNVDADTHILVFEPAGPLLWGVSNYLSGNYLLVRADEYDGQSNLTPVFIDENLGVTYRENKLHILEQRLLRHVPFVGVNLYE